MPLYCSIEIFKGLQGVRFPSSKQDLVEYAEQHDAPEAAIVMLNQLEDREFSDISDVCRNAGDTCSIQVAKALARLDFPATVDELIAAASAQGAPQVVISALQSIPADLVFSSVEEVCQYVAWDL